MPEKSFTDQLTRGILKNLWKKEVKPVKSLEELVEDTAKIRNDPSVAREHVVEALRRIYAGEETVEGYPTGTPSLKAVHELALRIESEGKTKN